MGAIARHKTATTDVAWDGPANEARLKLGGTEAYYRSAFAWQDPEGDATTKAAFRFIHHMVDTDGAVGDANVMACLAGIGVCNGARGGTTIPVDDKRGVYEHLAGHMRDAGKEPPEFKGEVEGPDLHTIDPRRVDALTVGAVAATYPNLWRWIAASIWAIVPERGLEALATIELVGAGRMMEIDAAATRQPDRAGAVAVLPLYGVLTQRGGLCGTSMSRFMGAFRQAVSDSEISAIVIDVDSPGGNVYGMDEAAAEIFAARGAKPIVAVSNAVMASAAYYVGSAAGEVVITPSGDIGSIGTYAVHTDQSGADAAEGIVNTVISAGKYKVEHSPFGPLSQEGRASLQKMVDEKYGQFVQAVARNRDTTPEAVRDGYGQGRMVGAREAVQLGLADRVDTLNGVLARLGVERASASRSNRAGAGALAEAEIAAQERERRLRRLKLEEI